MGGFFGVVSTRDCVDDLYFGTDYHSHLGMERGGMAVLNESGFTRVIHNISASQFRSKFEGDLASFMGSSGVGVISDYDDQPLVCSTHLGVFAIVTVGIINNVQPLLRELFSKGPVQFSEMSRKGVNTTELIAALISTQASIAEGIRYAQLSIDGSCSLLLLTAKGELYAARDRYGRTPVTLARKAGGAAFAAVSETCALPNLDYAPLRGLGPGEVVKITPDGVEPLAPPYADMAICAFLWTYYGYPASAYEDINVEQSRYYSGGALALRDKGHVDADFVAGVPDSGVGHALGYARVAGVPYTRPFVKYTPTWPRSFTPQEQAQRSLVARMKLIPIPQILHGKRVIFCDDSIVRGTQLHDQVQRLYDGGAKEIHMRIACPPILHSCKFLNFTRSGGVMGLLTRRTIRELEGERADIAPYHAPETRQHKEMVTRIQQRLGLTTLKYQLLEDLIAAIGLPAKKLCTYCWTGRDISCGSNCEYCPSAGDCKEKSSPELIHNEVKN
ncbi:MAG: amidophosphoribosyltransferase [Kiritimatiellaeota bacterium]|nr:amidophosphoribosyltransferase [Kiritimatiellota bacterium]